MAKARGTLGALAHASPEPDETLLVLSCMDLPLQAEIVPALDRRRLTGRYDHLNMAGGALGAVSTRFPHWGRTFYEQVALARAVHGVSRVVLVDHRNCGVYEHLLGMDLSKDVRREKDVHLAHQQKLRRKIHALDPGIQVDCWLLDRKGEIEDLTDAAELWLPGITERRRKPRTTRKGRGLRKAGGSRARTRR